MTRMSRPTDLTDEFKLAMTSLGTLTPPKRRWLDELDILHQPSKFDARPAIPSDAIPPAHRVRERIDDSAYVVAYWAVAAALVGAFALGVMVGRWGG